MKANLQTRHSEGWYSKIAPHYNSVEEVYAEIAKGRILIKTNYALEGYNRSLEFENDINMLYADKESGYEIERVFLYNLVFDEANRLRIDSSDKKVLFLSYEKINDYVLEQLCKIGTSRGLKESDLNRVLSKILLLDDLDVSMESILETIEQHHDMYSMVFIDSFSYLRFDEPRYDDAKDNQVYASHKLHFCARKHHIPFVITDTFRGQIKSSKDLFINDVRIYEIACVAPICIGLFAQDDKKVVIELMKNRCGKSDITTILNWDRKTMVIEQNLK